MSDIVLALVVDYGVPIVFCVTFLSCLALPLPSSLLMLAAGGFAATGDLSLVAVVLAAFCGAILGDNSGYWIARRLGTRVENWLSAEPKRAKLRDKCVLILDNRGGPAVFLTCWLFAPLGPSMNYVCGMSKFHWPRFVVWGMAGEVVWVSLYVGLGFTFADSVSSLSSVLSNASGFVTAFAVVIGLGWWLLRAVRARRSQMPSTA